MITLTEWLVVHLPGQERRNAARIVEKSPFKYMYWILDRVCNDGHMTKGAANCHLLCWGDSLPLIYVRCPYTTPSTMPPFKVDDDCAQVIMTNQFNIQDWIMFLSLYSLEHGMMRVLFSWIFFVGEEREDRGEDRCTPATRFAFWDGAISSWIKSFFLGPIKAPSKLLHD